MTPDERARVFAGYTPEKWLSDLLDDIKRAKAAGDWVAVAEFEEMFDEALASGKIRFH